MSGLADFERYDGLGLAELVGRREVKPEELLDAASARVEEGNPAAACRSVSSSRPPSATRRGCSVWRRSSRRRARGRPAVPGGPVDE